MARWQVFVFLTLYSFLGYATVFKKLELNQRGSQTALDLHLDAITYPKIFKLNNPYRLVVDLPNTTLSSFVPRLQHSDTYQVRVAQFSANITRVVIQSPTAIDYRSQSASNVGGYKIHIQLQQLSSPKVIPQPQCGKPIGQRKIVVVIDPGHGGKDPGARGYHRTFEKDVVLAIAKRLQQKINRQAGMQAVLTRDGDYFIDLRRRLDISRHYHADVFVAIHADAFTNVHSHGASVFALSSRGATSEAARWLAEKENHSELAGVNLRGLDDQNGMVRSVLMDLSQTATIQSGIKMGQNVLRYLGGMTTLHNQRVEQAGFVVLKSPDTPSILVETGFISNPIEEKQLASPSYQEKLSEAIFKGLYQYFKDYPPRGKQF